MDFPGEKLLLRLWETIAEKGVGGVLSPWQIRREGRARIDVRTEEMLALAQAERDVEGIRSGNARLLADGHFLELPESVASPSLPVGEPGSDDAYRRSLVARIEYNALADILRREVNVAKALLSAEAELELDAQEPPPRRVDGDWLLRWRDSAGAVSSEELQNLWGRLLAGEIKSPGAFSLRTLEFLKNLSRNEAIEIAKLSRFAVSGWIFKGASAILDSEGITFGYLLRMQQMGIISGVDALGLTITLGSTRPDRFEQGLVSHGRVLLVTHEDTSKRIQMAIYQLTSVGCQIIGLGTFEPHEPYLRSLGQAVQAQGFRVQIARYQQVTDSQGRYFDAQELDV